MTKGGIKVEVKVQGAPDFAISCGDAKQSIQWLASAIQTRLRTFHLMRKSLETDHYIVSEIRNNNGELINPKDKIYEHMEENNKLTVRATLATTYPVDDWENPAMNDWMQAAYLHGNASQHWAKEIEAWRYSLEQVKLSQSGNEVDNNVAVMAQKILPQTSQLIKIGFDFSKKDLELAFNLDWKVMRWSWIALNDQQRSTIGDILKTNYSLVCNIFAHYAGIGKGNT